eukprot:CAMPEP_0202899710 /NCGR_PEP_ID=MMETSP1392-20130828/7867_1 /ASSEMBLY_ACC=CAM_ASM_000868 /TAXON_ID=225041 /ORGANISM="Chlamydomonas chlamydogama, Strain SAG 11-48b" /LENGTH=154 /DNA_ID=CAMNT_0049585965 /DNA_START=94 /DNA_END=558 /DNA_ORIENTATION=-
MAMAGVELTEQEINEFREVFDLMDRDKGGTLSIEEVKQLMEMLGMKVKQDELEQLVSEIDIDGSGQVDFEEFLQVMARPHEVPFTKQDVLRAFSLFTEEGDPEGCIAPDMLEKALLKYCTIAPEDEVLRLLHNMDLTEDGYIDYAKKVNMYLSK